MKIQSGSETTFDLNGSTLRVNAKCNGIEEHTTHVYQSGRSHIINRAKWTVKLTFRGRAASFKYTIGEGNAGYSEQMDFDGFTECIVMDMCAGEMSYNDFRDEFGYSDSTTHRAVHTACVETVRKLNRVFSFRRGDFTDQADKGDWACLLASAAESLNTAHSC